jgi:hypothetical protein
MRETWGKDDRGVEDRNESVFE